MISENSACMAFSYHVAIREKILDYSLKSRGGGTCPLTTPQVSIPIRGYVSKLSVLLSICECRFG